MNIVSKLANGATYTVILPRSRREQEQHAEEFVKKPDESLWTSRQKRTHKKNKLLDREF